MGRQCSKPQQGTLERLWVQPPCYPGVEALGPATCFQLPELQSPKKRGKHWAGHPNEMLTAWLIEMEQVCGPESGVPDLSSHLFFLSNIPKLPQLTLGET